MDAEKAHYFVMKRLNTLTSFSPFYNAIRKYHEVDAKPVNFVGINFPNRIGMAAGFDKNAQYLHALSSLGFGHIETGTVTPLPQPGNEKPRLFRLPQDEALINRMGFNNQGADLANARILKFKEKNTKLIIGGNIGKNKDTPNENAADDYLKCFKTLYDAVDYFTVNVSSPNTANLRMLQEKESLLQILNTLQHQKKEYTDKGKASKPILLKIAPDLTFSQVDEIIEVVLESKIDGLIATNTTIDRSNLKSSQKTIKNIGNGGLSGKPLTQKSTEILAYIHKNSNGKIPMIASGGIMSGEDAKIKMDAGASLVQIYSGFIYKGTGLVKEINKSISSL